MLARSQPVPEGHSEHRTSQADADDRRETSLSAMDRLAQ